MLYIYIYLYTKLLLIKISIIIINQINLFKKVNGYLEQSMNIK